MNFGAATVRQGVKTPLQSLPTLKSIASPIERVEPQKLVAVLTQCNAYFDVGFENTGVLPKQLAKQGKISLAAACRAEHVHPGIPRRFVIGGSRTTRARNAPRRCVWTQPGER